MAQARDPLQLSIGSSNLKVRLHRLLKNLFLTQSVTLTESELNHAKLADIAQRFELPLSAVLDVCLLHRNHQTPNAYWERWNQLYAQLSGKFYTVMEAVGEALKQTPRASSMVENLNSRLRNYFFLRRSLGDSYLNLLQFFLNYRCFMRSQVPERVGKSPTQLLTQQSHPHWLELLGFQRFQRA